MDNTDAQTSRRLPLGAVKPTGWYSAELQLQAEGITGCIDAFWDSVGNNSGWLGGSGENWERGPYYLDGLIPLAYLLEDDRLMKKVKVWVDAFLESASSGGNFGPENGEDVWSRTVMLKCMLQYVEATGSMEVTEQIVRYCQHLLTLLKDKPLASYGSYRGGDLLYCIRWLSERTGEAFLPELFDLVSTQVYDWCGDFMQFPFTRPTEYYYPWHGGMERFSYEEMPSLMKYHETHCVNIAMGLKLPAVKYADSQNEYFRTAFNSGMNNLIKYHGTAQGIFTGDEHLAGANPTQGTELCEIVELLFSLYMALEAFDDYRIADHIEKVAYNALPAQFSPDYSRHQYLQQTNQVLISRADRNWYNNAPDSNLFGLEPNFGCCTANQHQGWPKLAQSLFHMTKDGICAAVYAPCKVKYRGFTITEETAYPFDESINFHINGREEKRFTLRLRVPEWCEEAVCITPEEILMLKPGWYDLHRVFRDGEVITLRLPMKPRISYWYKQSAAVELGPLVFALPIEGEWRKTEGRKNYPDYEVWPKTDWNYAISCHTQDMLVERSTNPVRGFDPENPPVRIGVWARKLECWKLENGSAGELPASPVESTAEWERLKLVPYGLTTLRITQFPWLTPTESRPGREVL